MFNKISREYNQGYTAALLDVERLLESEDFILDLKVHKKTMTKKNLINLLKCLLEGRAILRENPDAWVRCNNDSKYGFEICIGNLKNDGYVYKQLTEVKI